MGQPLLVLETWVWPHCSLCPTRIPSPFAPGAGSGGLACCVHSVRAGSVPASPLLPSKSRACPPQPVRHVGLKASARGACPRSHGSCMEASLGGGRGHRGGGRGAAQPHLVGLAQPAQTRGHPQSSRSPHPPSCASFSLERDWFSVRLDDLNVQEDGLLFNCVFILLASPLSSRVSQYARGSREAGALPGHSQGAVFPLPGSGVAMATPQQVHPQSRRGLLGGCPLSKCFEHRARKVLEIRFTGLSLTQMAPRPVSAGGLGPPASSGRT